jgi:hypothetical protein
MDAGKQLIRYSLPGGVFIGLVAVFDLLLRWAWQDKPTAAFALITNDGLATAVGVVILGFIIYQFYYSMHQPVVRFPLPRSIRFGRTFDQGGWILMGLSSDKKRNKAILAQIRTAQGIKGVLGYARDVRDDDKYQERWYRNMHAVRSLLSATRSTGDSHIRDDYVTLGDIYHVLGACRISTLFAGVAALIHAGLHYNLVANHPFRSLGALVGSLYIVALWLRVVQHNRRDTLHTMRRQLRRDLRMWLARHPEYLTTHLDVREEIESTLQELATGDSGDGARAKLSQPEARPREASTESPV